MTTGLDIAAGAIGIVGVAQQLTNSIFSIKRFCRQVKNAPEELRDTLDQIENMGNTMARLEGEVLSDTAVDASQEVFKASMKLRQKAVERISMLASQLQSTAKWARVRAGVKIVLNQDVLKDMLERLDRSKADLHFAYSMYTDACRRREFESLRRYLEEERNGQVQLIDHARMVAVPCSEAETGSIPDNEERRVNHGRLGKSSGAALVLNTVIHIRLPFWLCQYAWDVAFQRSSGYLTMSLKSFRVLEWDNPVWEMISTGDITSVRDLFGRRQISIHDETPEGDSLCSVCGILGEYCDFSDSVRSLSAKGRETSHAS